MKKEKRQSKIKNGRGDPLLLAFFFVVFHFYFSVFNLSPARAQFSLPAPISLAASPASPSPGETVAVQAVTPSFDRHTARFDWVIDGKARPEISGFGKNVIELTAGAVGSVARVGVSVSRPNGAIGVGGGEATLTIRVTDLVITFIAETLVPRWYRGKALPTPNSIVNVIAVPEFIIDGRSIGPGQLVYRWTLDDQRNALAGVGEQVFRIRTSDLPGTSHEVKVTVEDLERKVVKTGQFFIVPYSPRLTLYRSTPLGGVESRTTGPFAQAARGLFDVIAEPFFFAASSRRDLSYKWDVAGIPAAGIADNPHLITVDTNRRPTGRFEITASVDDDNILVPSATKTLTLFLQ